MDSYNGYQVFCDKPVLAHTMFSKFKLTETNTVADSHVWEGRAAETGLVYNDASAGTFSYTDENFEAIPAGCYYIPEIFSTINSSNFSRFLNSENKKFFILFFIIIIFLITTIYKALKENKKGLKSNETINPFPLNIKNLE